MKRIVITSIATLLTAASLWAGGEDEVIVTRQLTTGQRNALPEKTITVEIKELTPSKKADSGLIDAIVQVMDTIASEDYQNRTFVLMLDPHPNGEVGIAAHSDDIVTQGSHDATIYYGTLEHRRYHFVVLAGKDNGKLLEQTFKRQGKVKFVQEFEFVDFKTPIYPTNVIAKWSLGKGLVWETVYINDDCGADHPSHPQDIKQK